MALAKPIEPIVEDDEFITIMRQVGALTINQGWRTAGLTLPTPVTPKVG
jgi:hypothetical protein